MRKNVAFYGGSFDMPTIGHVMVASHVILNEDMIDEQIVVPCFQHLEKTGQAPFQHRFDMALEAFSWLPKTTVSPVEAQIGGGSLTVRTIRELKRQNPNWHMYVVMGSDLMANATKWEGWDELINEATPLIVGRAGMPSSMVSGPVRTAICPAISSTEVRDMIVKGDYATAERYLPRGVLKIIRANGLYL